MPQNGTKNGIKKTEKNKKNKKTKKTNNKK